MSFFNWLGGARRNGSKQDQPIQLKGPFYHQGGNAWIAKSAPATGDSDSGRHSSTLCLHEDGHRLTAAHQHIDAIRMGGAGRYAHWGNVVVFSATDGTDPNANGRRYAFDFSLTLEEWERDRISRHARRWLRHDDGARFMGLGGENTPPPIIANLGLTNKCNLRCEICGSQKHLDSTGVRRRHMEYATFEAVAETLFPILSQVELNSQGDPLLHPRIMDILSTIERHRCETKIQHNGTLLSNPIVDAVLRQHGEVMLSLDAVGDKFDEVRSGGVWRKALPGLSRLLRERDPKRLSIGVYPTLTQRTIGEALNVARWAAENGVDQVVYHRYVPVHGSWEKAPDEAEYQSVRDSLREWCESSDDKVRIQFEGESLNATTVQSLRSEFADPEKYAALVESGKMIFPVEAGQPGGDPFSACAAPHDYVEIGLEGHIGACCRAQDVKLGLATSIDAFARAWFGRNYGVIRKSLQRGAEGPLPLPNCSGCMKFFAPKEARDRPPADYSQAPSPGELRLRFAEDEEIEIEGIQKEDGKCHIAVFPIGLGEGEYELLEDGVPLGPAPSYHADIRAHGAGRYHIGPTSVYFSTSDGSDARRNGRMYTLVKKKPAQAVLVG